MNLEAMKAKYIPEDNLFYRDYYSYFVIALSILLLIVLIVWSVVMYQLSHRPLPVFYAVQKTGVKMKLDPFEEPNLLPDTILRWASKAAVAAYTYNFLDYRKQLAAVRPYFTEAGWADYQSSANNLVAAVVRDQLFVNGVVAGTPIIANQGSLPGQAYAWRIQIPFLVSYQNVQNVNSLTTRNYFVVLTIVRVPTTYNPQGIGIDQFVMV